MANQKYLSQNPLVEFNKAYRCKYNGKIGIGWRGPFNDEVTIIFDDKTHCHVDLNCEELEVMEEVYVSDENRPKWSLIKC